MNKLSVKSAKDSSMIIQVNKNDVLQAIEEAQLPTDVSTWLSAQAEYLADLVNVYSKNPDTFGLHDDLRSNPIRIIKTMLLSAETLYRYQGSYDSALIKLAHVNGVPFTQIEEIPELLQKVTFAKEKGLVSKHLAGGGKVVIGLMGSGASGKGTIGKRTGMQRAVNYTTRYKRPGEDHGKDYFYIRELEPKVADTLDIDTGFNTIANAPSTFEVDTDGKPVNYFEKYGPYVAIVHRPGRALHGTPVGEFTKHFEKGERAIFFEHGPIQVQEVGDKLPTFNPEVKVLPVCILPPKTGIVPLALRIVVRTYGDPTHKDPNVEAYKIKDEYLDSTIGLGQIAELEWTSKFTEGDKPLGVVYIVNDNLQKAVDELKELVAQ